MPFTAATTAFWWAKAVEVSSVASTGAVVMLGDSASIRARGGSVVSTIEIFT